MSTPSGTRRGHRWRAAAWWMPCAAVWLLVSWLVLTPAEPGGGGLPIPDKLAHLLAWLGLAVTAWPALRASTRWSRAARASVVLGVCACWAVATEVLQGAVPGRSGDPLDAAADIAGAALGVTAWWLYESRRGASTVRPRRSG